MTELTEINKGLKDKFANFVRPVNPASGMPGRITNSVPHAAPKDPPGASADALKAAGVGAVGYGAWKLISRRSAKKAAAKAKSAKRKKLIIGGAATAGTAGAAAPLVIRARQEE